MNYNSILNFIKKNFFNVILGIIIIIMIIVIIFNIVLYFKIDNKEDIKEIVSEEKEKVNDNYIKVEIKGMVNSPGVYECLENDRVIDVINKAGGLQEGANTELLNLSKKITDQMVIIIYSNDFINSYKENNKKIEYVYVEIEKCPDSINQACINSSSENNQVIEETKENNIQMDETIDTKVENEAPEKISLNNASKEQLMTLSGIGESKADNIIKYREENNGFKDINEILNVKGIGNSILEKIKEDIII